MKIASHDQLRECKERFVCPTCNGSRKYYCYTCFVPNPSITLPSVPKLPFNLHIIKDPRELDGKSTAVQARILCGPDQVCISEDFVDLDASAAVVLFPSKDAKQLYEVDWSRTSTVIVIEGTWSQAKTINRTIPASITRVTLPPARTSFWRYQSLGEHCLSTIEAIHAIVSNVNRHGSNFDNLLWFFAFQYHLIQAAYKKDSNMREFTSRHRPGYIKQ